MSDRTKIYHRIYEFYKNEAAYDSRKELWASRYGRWLLLNPIKVVRNLFLDFLRKNKTNDSVDRNESLRGKRWVVVGTRNHYNAVSFLRGQNNYRLVSGDSPFSVTGMIDLRWRRTPLVKHLTNYLPFLYSFLVSNPKQFLRMVVPTIGEVGAFEEALSVMGQYRPEAIVLSNDHLPFYRAVAEAARTLGIPSIYIQHASVGKDFPSLIFDLSLLEGADSIDKYHLHGKEVRGKTELMGMPKFDHFVANAVVPRSLESIGIPYNAIVSPQLVKELVERLTGDFPDITITVRPHPSDRRPIDLAAFPRATLSTPEQEGPFEFLSRQSVIITPNSSIALEAALLNIYPIYYGPMNKMISEDYDSYGFVEQGLVDDLATYADLRDKLNSLVDTPFNIRHRAEQYCFGLNTELEGNYGKRGLQLIDSFLASYQKTTEKHD